MNKLLLSASIALICAGGAHAASLTKSTATPSAPVPSAACPTGPGFLTYNVDCTPTAANTVACNNTGPPQTGQENSYYRRYVLSASSPPNVQISTVRLAIESANVPVPGAMAKVYTIPNGSPLVLANLTQIGSAPIPVTEGLALAELTVTISPTAVVDTPATKNIVVELFQPDLTGVGTMFFGSNATGTGVTYIRAPGCGAAEPVDLQSLGSFPNVKIIASLAGAGLPVELQEYKVD